MVRRSNPHPLGPNTTLELRDSKGRFAIPSRSTNFTIYKNGAIIYAETFPSGSTVSDKWELIEIIRRELLDIDEAPVLVSEEPKTKLTNEDRKDLADHLYLDLVELLEFEDPAVYTEITDDRLTFRERIESKELLSDEWGAIAVFKYYYTILRAQHMQNPQGPDLVWFFRRYLEGPLKEAYETMPESIEDMYLFRMTYDIKTGTGWSNEGVGPRRLIASSWEELRNIIYETLFEQLLTDMKKYIDSSFEQTIRITGFTLETIWEEL